FLVGDDGCLMWAASHGLPDSYVQASLAPQLRLDKGIAAQALATRRPLLVADLSREPRFSRPAAALASGYQSLLCAPLMAQTNPVGTLQLYGNAERRLAPELIPLVQATAEQLAVAIANAHLHQTVKASEAEYRSLVENLPKLIFRLDLHGRCIFAKRAVQTILVWPPPAFMGAPSLREFLGHPADWPDTAMARVLNGETIQGLECRMRHHDGNWRWCELTLYPWQRGDARVLGIEGIAEDITERKRIAQEMA